MLPLKYEHQIGVRQVIRRWKCRAKPDSEPGQLSAFLADVASAAVGSQADPPVQKVAHLLVLVCLHPATCLVASVILRIARCCSYHITPFTSHYWLENLHGNALGVQDAPQLWTVQAEHRNGLSTQETQFAGRCSCGCTLANRLLACHPTRQHYINIPVHAISYVLFLNGQHQANSRLKSH